MIFTKKIKKFTLLQGFVRNDSITIVARVSVTKTQGVGLVLSTYFFEKYKTNIMPKKFRVENNTRDFSEKNDMSDVCLIIENKQVHVTKAVC